MVNKRHGKLGFAVRKKYDNRFFKELELLLANCYCFTKSSINVLPGMAHSPADFKPFYTDGKLKEGNGQKNCTEYNFLFQHHFVRM